MFRENPYEVLAAEAQDALNTSHFVDARHLWARAAEEVNGPDPQLSLPYSLARHGEAQAIYWGDLPGEDGMEEIHDSLCINDFFLSGRVNYPPSFSREAVLREDMCASTLAGRIVVRKALRLEVKCGGAVFGITNKELATARKHFARARLRHDALVSEYPRPIEPNDPMVVHLGACLALGEALYPHRNQNAVAQQARQARDAAKECQNYIAGGASKVARAAQLVNRLMTPDRSLRRSLAVRIATWPGVF